MKQPFNTLTRTDVEILRKKRSCVPAGTSIRYTFSLTDILNAKRHLESLYMGRVNHTFAERILILNAIY